MGMNAWMIAGIVLMVVGVWVGVGVQIVVHIKKKALMR